MVREKMYTLVYKNETMSVPDDITDRHRLELEVYHDVKKRLSTFTVDKWVELKEAMLEEINATQGHIDLLAMVKLMKEKRREDDDIQEEVELMCQTFTIMESEYLMSLLNTRRPFRRNVNLSLISKSSFGDTMLEILTCEVRNYYETIIVHLKLYIDEIHLVPNIMEFLYPALSEGCSLLTFM